MPLIRRSRDPGTIHPVALGPRWTRSPGGMWRRVTDTGLPAYSPGTTSLNLDGSDELVDFTHYSAVDFELSDSFSVFVWHKNALNTGGSAVNKHHWVTDTAGYRLRIENGFVYGEMWGSGSSYARKYKDISTDDGAWHMAGFTYDGSASGAYTGFNLYNDGALITGETGTGTATTTIKHTSPLEVGGISGGVGGSWHYDGTLCHSAVWSKELTADEVAAIYGPGTPRDLSHANAPSNLVHWCTLGDGCAIGAGNCPDLSSENKDGSTVNVESGDFVADYPS